MYKINFTIEGIAPLRMNRFSEGATASLITRKNAKRNSEDAQKQEAYDRSYCDEKEGYYVPSAALKKCIIMGAKRVKTGRKSAMSDLSAVFHIKDKNLYLGTKKETGLHGERVRIPPKTGACAFKYWVYFENWKLKTEAVVLDDRIHHSIVKDAISEAGIYQGLLDGRPDWGRFQLTEFKVVE